MSLPVRGPTAATSWAAQKGLQLPLFLLHCTACGILVPQPGIKLRSTAPCGGRVESWPLDCRGSSLQQFKVVLFRGEGAALLTITKSWKQSNCPSIEEWIKKIRCVYTMEHYSTIKKKRIKSCHLWQHGGPRRYYTVWNKSDRER